MTPMLVKTTSLLPPNPDYRNRTTQNYQKSKARLKADIAINGIRTPLMVTPDLTTFAGGTRRECALELGLDTVPVIIVEGLTTFDMLALAHKDNALHNKPSMQERIESLAAAMANGQGKTLDEIAAATAESVATVSKVSTMIANLTQGEMELVKNNILPFRAAYTLSKEVKDQNARTEYIERLMDKKMTCDGLERELNTKKKTQKKVKRLTLKIGDGTFSLPADMEAIKATIGKLDELVKRIEKHGLPVTILPNMT